jgi:hypothetical protein
MALRYHGFYKEAIDEATLGLEPATAEEKFDLHNRIGRTYFGLSEDNAQPSNEELATRKDNLGKALYHFEEALKEKLSLGNNELQKKKLGRTYQLKAKIEIFLDKSEAALSSMAEATAIGRALNDGSDSAIYFSDLVEGLGERSQWRHITNLLGMVNETQLTARCTSQTHKLIQHATKIGDQAGQRRELAESPNHIVRLRQMYQAAIRTLDMAHDPFSGSIRGWLAVFERSVVQNILEAKELLYKVLDPSLGGIWWVTPASWQLSNILLEEFRLATALDEKEKIRDEMERLFELMAELLGPEFQPEQSQISIPLSIMRRKLGPAAAFYRGANATFKGCIETLTDNLSSNDAPSFQMLAKILSLLPGLEWHAQVASSCQFYIVDMAVYEHEQSSQVSVSVHRKNVVAADHYRTTGNPASNYYPGPNGQAASLTPPGFGNTPRHPDSQQTQALYSSRGGGNQAWLHSSSKSSRRVASQASSFSTPGFGNMPWQNNNQGNPELYSHASLFSSQQNNVTDSFGYGANQALLTSSQGFGNMAPPPPLPSPRKQSQDHFITEQQPGRQGTTEQTSILASRYAFLDAGGTGIYGGPHNPETGGMENYDVNHQWRVTCTSCQKVLNPKSASYLCYFCTNSILCKECHGADEGSVAGLRTPCPAGHCHIETPVKGWRGVRNDVLVFEFGKLGFKVWLDSLKMRWEDAWKRFWAESDGRDERTNE